MGAGGSTQAPPPPRLYKRERVSLAGTEDPILSTIRTTDLPPAITPTALAGIRLCAGLRRHHVFSTDVPAEDDDVLKTGALVSKLVVEAVKACNIRDYVVLLIEKTVLRLGMDLGPPTEDLLAVARFLNPFLARGEEGRGHGGGDGGNSGGGEEGLGGGSGLALAGAFRETDGALITDAERDLLVLLYYCHRGIITGSPEEAIKHMADAAEKYGTIKDLDTRKEPLTETEIYIHWALMFLATNISTEIDQTTLPAASRALLTAELSTQLTRLLTITEVLVADARLDQACFLLEFLPRLAAREEKGWWRLRAKAVGRNLRRKAPPVSQAWHAEFAERTVKRVVKGKGKGEAVGEGALGRSSLSFSRDTLVLDGDVWKGA
ncbi:uncharacterized protein DNG_06687 [Cephalotrichum gorgonifer]|uniref:Uncharacterized protein n=1 Tax=Cephalotrichum gorgonifer TaxID=2041049 RepID=A0AAE8SWU3_9PEZI|nr:uncharacterized protein DNG_06687 [Cephalotrichum gorgonifer]